MSVTEKEAYEALVYLVLSDLYMVEKFPTVPLLGDLQTNIQHLANQNGLDSSEDLQEFIKCCILCGYKLEETVTFFTTKETPDKEKFAQCYEFLNKNNEYLSKKADWDTK